MTSRSEEETRALIHNEEVESGSSEDPVDSMLLEEVLYCSASYHAMFGPVSISMILAAMSVIFINTEQTIVENEEALAHTYTVFNTEHSDASIGVILGLSLINGLVIVTVIGLMTFVIVILYKYRCMMLLIGYMILSSAVLLGMMGGTILEVAINKYRIPVDTLSFYVFLYNFAVVGVSSIFFQRGIPVRITQAYLICTSVILAWSLSHFDEWTAWTLLVMLALYDLCAVLTPCGPLKALVNLMSQEGSPDMPGLLYEAALPPEIRRPHLSTQQPTTAENRQEQRQLNQTDDVSIPSSSIFLDLDSPDAEIPNREGTTLQYTEGETGHDTPEMEDTANIEFLASIQPTDSPRTFVVPRAIALVYKLPLASEAEESNWDSISSLLQPRTDARETNGDTSHRTSRRRHFTPDQLKEEVEVVFPTNGGWIERGNPTSEGEPRFVVYDRKGMVRRVLILGNEGSVYGERQTEANKSRNSIRRGMAPSPIANTRQDGRQSDVSIPSSSIFFDLHPSVRSHEEVIQQNHEGQGGHNTPETEATNLGVFASTQSTGAPRTIVLPRAIALVYKLALANETEESNWDSTTPLLQTEAEARNDPSHETSQGRHFTPDQLKEELEFVLPTNGGWIERGNPTSEGELRFVVYDREGIVRRVLILSDDGSVYGVCEAEDKNKNSIRLGLGDFIFYSVLVSKASTFSFTTFASCMLVILCGLGGTLVLLALYKRALPALPISIFLGVSFYLLTREIIQPWIQSVFQKPYFV